MFKVKRRKIEKSIKKAKGKKIAVRTPKIKEVYDSDSDIEFILELIESSDSNNIADLIVAAEMLFDVVNKLVTGEKENG